MPFSSVPGRACGVPSSSPSRLQTRTRSRVSSGRRSRAPSSGSTRTICSPGPYGDHHHRHVRVASDEPGALAVTVARCRPRPAVQSRRRCRGGAAGRTPRRRPAPGRSVPAGRRRRSSLVASSSSSGSDNRSSSPVCRRPAPGSPPPAGQLGRVVHQGLVRSRVSTAIATAGRSSDNVSELSVRRWCLRPNPSTPRSSTLVAISMTAEQVQQGVGDEPAPDPVAFTEVHRQLEAVRVHARVPIHRPSGGGGDTQDQADDDLSAAERFWRSSVSRCVSNIHVENVV